MSELRQVLYNKGNELRESIARCSELEGRFSILHLDTHRSRTRNDRRRVCHLVVELAALGGPTAKVRQVIDRVQRRFSPKNGSEKIRG